MAGQNPLNPELDKEDENAQGQPSNQNVLGGQEQATTQPGGMPQAQQAAPAQKGSGSFTNIQNFLGANKNFAQKQGGLAGKISGRIGTQVGQAQKTLASEKQKFGQTLGNIKQGAEQTKQAMEPSLGYLGGAEGTKFSQQFQRDEQGNLVRRSTPGEMSVAAEPQANNAAPTLNTDLAKQNIQKAIEMKYAGPERLGAEKELEASKQSLGELGQATANQEGRFGLLKRFFNKPTYSTGQQRLDQLLVQGNQPQLEALRGTRQKTAQFGGAFDKARGQALQDVAQTRGTVQEIAGQAKTRTGEIAGTAEQQMLKDIADRNRVIQESEMYGTQGREELKQALAAQGLNLDDIGIELDTKSAFGQPGLASASLAESSIANLGNLDIERANRLNALRQLSGKTDLVPVATEEAGTDINVGLGGELLNRINQSRGDISAYAKAAQGADAFTGEEEKQWRGRMLGNRIDAMFEQNNVDQETMRQWAASDPELAKRVGVKEAAKQLMKRRASFGTSTGFNPEWVQGLTSKEEVVQSIRDNIGNELRGKFGFLGRTK
jgi:hypothetical protein